MKESITANDIIELLNDALKIDKEAISKIFLNRVLCNEKLANHPTIQISAINKYNSTVSALGILNGLFGTYDDGPKEGWGYIAAIARLMCPYCKEKPKDDASKRGDVCPNCGKSNLYTDLIEEFVRVENG